MCVIMLAQRTRPTDEMIEKAWAQNDDGAGIAWRENGEVFFEKGIMEIEGIKELCAKVPMPYVVHFRVASIGGVKPELTHPFPINKKAPLYLSGKTKGGVLFHNGHWSDWSAKAMEAAIHSNTPVPTGVYSDTRAMAWLLSIYGPGFMEFLPQQRGVYFTPTQMDVFTGPGWTKVNEIWCSNDIFWNKGKGSFSGPTQTTNYSTYGRICHVGRCTNKALAGKTTCESCEKKPSSGTNVTPLPAVGATGAQGGAGNTTAPFAPAGTFLTKKEAEIRYRQGDMSKNMMKRFQKHHDQLLSKNPKAISKATKELLELTVIANQRLFKNGSKG